MTPSMFLEACEANGVNVRIEGGRLLLRGPREAVEKVAPMAKPIKAQVIEHLTWPRPDILAQLGHALRVRPDTAVTESEKASLVERCASLPDDTAVDALLLKLFNYWRKTSAPSLTAFLDSNKRRAVA